MVQYLTLDQPPIETPRVLFDISRLLRNRRLPFGTGVDRIDLCYAQMLRQMFGDRCEFVHAGATGLSFPDQGFVDGMLEALDRRWKGLPHDAKASEFKAAAAAAARLRGARALLRRRNLADYTYFVASHSGLCQRSGLLRKLDPGFSMRRMAYLHDLIPLEFPEYQTRRSVRLFRRFLAELNQSPTHYLANSSDTADRVRLMAKRNEWPATGIEVARPKFRQTPAPQGDCREKVKDYVSNPLPFFLMVGTIEPRKNHLLVLNIWREFAAAEVTPRLCIVGRRGWENQNVINMLERCEAIRRHVTEFNDLKDCEVHHMIRHCASLLMPSFAEGLGIPVMEAGALNAPAIVSDLPALRGVAAKGTVFLDPMNGSSWRSAITSAFWASQGNGLRHA